MNLNAGFALGEEIDKGSDDFGGFGLGDLGEEGTDICQQRSNIIKPVRIGKKTSKEVDGLFSDFNICFCGGFVRENNFAEEVDGVVGVGICVLGGFVKKALQRGHDERCSNGEERKERKEEGSAKKKRETTDKKENEERTKSKRASAPKKICSKRKKFAITKNAAHLRLFGGSFSANAFFLLFFLLFGFFGRSGEKNILYDIFIFLRYKVWGYLGFSYKNELSLFLLFNGRGAI